jgi:branched-chain amino acid transport system substrate-binding protein
MKKMRDVEIFVLLLVLSCFFLGLPSSSFADAPKEIRIGATAPLTGPAAEAGVALKEGIVLAVEEVNAKGGIYIEEAGKNLPIKVFIEDCQSKPEVGVSVGEKLITREKVHVLLGDTFHSSVTMAVMELAPKYGIPVMSLEPVSSEIAKKIKKDPKRYWSFWKSNWNSEDLGASPFHTYQYLINNGLFQVKNKRIAFIVEDTDWGRSNAQVANDLFEGEGWKSLGIEIVPLGYTDFYPQLTKIKANDPDILITSFTALSSGVAYTKQFDELGMKCGHMAIYYPLRPEYLPQVGDLGEYILWTTTFIDPINVPKHVALANKIKKRWKASTSADHATGYDAIYNVADSIKRAGSVNAKAIVEALSKLDREGALGRYVFRQEDHAVWAGEDYLPIPGIQIQNSKNVIIYPTSLATGKYLNPPWLSK